MRTARVQAQAKVNLFLRIGVRQPDGYHDLSTLFQRIDLADAITVRVGGSRRSLDVAGPALPYGGLGPAARNLAYRAAEAFAARTGGDFARGFEIELTKNIPVGAGLGGGSADAGGVLRALNALAERPLPQDELLGIAASLGSDVPFLASEHVCAFGAGRGERLSATSPEMPAEMLILVPGFAIATADAYRWLDEARATRALQESEDNSFEPVLDVRYPVLRQMRGRLMASGARLARLAGSGSCVFGIFPDHLPAIESLGVDARVIATRTSARVVEVEVQQ